MDCEIYKIVAYQLQLSLDHLDSLPIPEEREYGEVEDFDALIYKPTAPEGADSTFLEREVPYQGLEPINWLGFLNRLPQVDFLRSNLSWPIMSKRMLYVLRSVGDFPHKTIPIRIFDYSLFDYRRDRDKVQTYLKKDYYPPEVCNQDYVVVQLLEATDAIDTELSEYDEPEPDSIFLPHIIDPVLREPTGGFPPIFRLPDYMSLSLFVSPVAKHALRESGIRGLRFYELEGIPLPNSPSYIHLQPIPRIRPTNDPLPRQVVAYELSYPYEPDMSKFLQLYEPDRPDLPIWAESYKHDSELDVENLSEEEQRLAWEQEEQLDEIYREQEIYDTKFRTISDQLHYHYPCATEYTGPDPIICLGDLNQIQGDILPNDESWTIVSLSVLEVMCSIGKINCRVIPVRIFDINLKHQLEKYISVTDLSPEICNQNYVALQVLEQLDAVDWERTELSEWDERRMSQGFNVSTERYVSGIQKLILKEPAGGFPPIFWVNALTGNLISVAAKKALEKRDFRNLEFRPYEGTCPI